MDVSFSKIEQSQVEQLQEIALETFIHSYQHLNKPQNFQFYIDRAFTIEKLKSELASNLSFFFFVSIESTVIGYLKLNIGEAQSERFDDSYLEIERIYLRKNFQGKGIGRKMITYAEFQAEQLNKSTIWLGVWDQNPNAIAFYSKLGFIQTGSHIFKFGDEDQIDIIMQKVLL